MTTTSISDQYDFVLHLSHVDDELDLAEQTSFAHILTKAVDLQCLDTSSGAVTTGLATLDSHSDCLEGDLQPFSVPTTEGVRSYIALLPWEDVRQLGRRIETMEEVIWEVVAGLAGDRHFEIDHFRDHHDQVRIRLQDGKGRVMQTLDVKRRPLDVILALRAEGLA